MITDPDTFELKPEIKDGTVVFTTSAIGGLFIDLRDLLIKNTK